MEPQKKTGGSRSRGVNSGSEGQGDLEKGLASVDSAGSKSRRLAKSPGPITFISQ